jgi:hypothetical protein
VASRLWTAALALALAASLAGCVSIETGGPVLSSSVTQGPGEQGQHYLQLVPKPPANGWGPSGIVQGFLQASASFGYWQIAREYLAPGTKWNPSWSATVYSEGPNVSKLTYPKGRKDSAVVTIGGKVQANLSNYGGYAVPLASSAQQTSPPPSFKLEKVGGQWRISQVPVTAEGQQELLLSSVLFNYDYQLRNLYFFDPTTNSYLVPDPVYVPLQATPVDLVRGLVSDLIPAHLPDDWLSPAATTTAFPEGTSLTDVTLAGGTATVSLSIPTGKGSKKASTALTSAEERMSAQLLYTLTGSGQGGSAVQSVELSVNGTPYIPAVSQGNPVQNRSQSGYRPPAGQSGKFYYLDDGNLLERDITAGTINGSSAKVGRIGKEFSQVAVSPPVSGSGQYVAALNDENLLYAGPLGGKLTRQRGSGYESISWDPNGDLWATTGSGIVMLPEAEAPGQPLGQPVPVTVVSPEGTPSAGPFSALRVAPDGVRVAIVFNGSTLNFGAIVSPPASTRASQAVIKIELSPFAVTLPGTAMFTAVSWYGPDNVITLSQPGAALTEYPVNGGSSTSIPTQGNILWITASEGSPLVAGLGGKGGGLMTDTSLTAVWPPVPTIKNGSSPVYPG